MLNFIKTFKNWVTDLPIQVPSRKLQRSAQNRPAEIIRRPVEFQNHWHDTPKRSSIQQSRYFDQKERENLNKVSEVNPEILSAIVALYQFEQNKLYPVPADLLPYGLDHYINFQILREKILDYVGNPGTPESNGKSRGWKQYAGLLTNNISDLEQIADIILSFFLTKLPYAWQYTDYGVSFRFANIWERTDRIPGTNQLIHRKILVYHSWQFDFMEEDSHLEVGKRRLKPPKLLTAYVVPDVWKSHKKDLLYPNFGVMGCSNFRSTDVYPAYVAYSEAMAAQGLNE